MEGGGGGNISGEYYKWETKKTITRCLIMRTRLYTVSTWCLYSGSAKSRGSRFAPDGFGPGGSGSEGTAEGERRGAFNVVVPSIDT